MFSGFHFGGCPPWSFFATAGLCLIAAAACKRSDSVDAPPGTGERPLVIGASVMNLSSEFIAMITHSMEAKAKELGVELVVNDAQRSPERQVQQIESFIAQKVDAIIINPCEVEASSPGVDKAVAAGIPIVSVNSETRSKPTAFIGSRDEESARLAMEFIASRLGGKGNLLIMQGFLGQAAQIRRDQGAREVLARYPGITILAEQTAECDRAKAMTLMENWIQAHGSKINAVFAHNDEMGLGAVLALQRAKMKPNVVVVSVDAIADALHAVKDGLLDATVFQDSVGQGSTAVETALKLIRKQPFDAEVFIPFQLVTKDNVSQYLTRQHRK
jgi:inositol transport system substrate-binding protein